MWQTSKPSVGTSSLTSCNLLEHPDGGTNAKDFLFLSEKMIGFLADESAVDALRSWSVSSIVRARDAYSPPNLPTLMKSSAMEQ